MANVFLFETVGDKFHPRNLVTCLALEGQLSQRAVLELRDAFRYNTTLTQLELNYFDNDHIRKP
jgi:hypothetical protein